MSLKLSDKTILGDGNPCFIIAEIGQNHQGDIKLAKEMILRAKECGVDCVKFQRSNFNAKFTRSALERPYRSHNSFGETYGEHKRFLEFSMKDFWELQKFSEDHQILFTASAMDEVAIGDLLSMGVPFLKIGSGDINNLPLLRLAKNSGKPLIISTGMQNHKTIEMVYSMMEGRSFGLLHCVSAYPTDVKDANLQFIRVFQETFPKAIIGYSGHEVGQDISLAAVSMGAKILERHFTLDKNLKGSDHKCSLEPQELAELVKNIRGLERFLSGRRIYEAHEITSAMEAIQIIPEIDLQEAFSGEKRRRLLQCEQECHQKLGKSLVFAKNADYGEILTEKHLAIKVSHPKGIDPEDLDKTLGRKLLKSVELDTPVLEDLLL